MIGQKPMVNLKEILSWVTPTSSICVQFVGVQICFQIMKKGSTGDLSNFPFLCFFINACLWLRYGLMTEVFAVVAANCCGVILQFSYMTVFYLYTTHKNHLYRQYLMGCASLFAVLAYIKYYVEEENVAIEHLGVISDIVTVISYGAPLVTLRQVLRTKTTDSMSFLMCFANLLIAVQWLSYGVLLEDLYIALPNIAGLLLGVLQMFLFCKYPSSKSRPSAKVFVS